MSELAHLQGPLYDLLIVGGGINGAGIARDAAGRGLNVLLCEKDDLAAHTSSASTKLIHGGLRYLEHYEFGLVRKALIEREVLLKSAPHIMRPLRFVMPHAPGQRPAWLVRSGLMLYDRLARRQILPGSQAIDLTRHPAGIALQRHYTRGFEYSDGLVDDARLVVLCAQDAAQRGATVITRCECTGLERLSGHWLAHLRSADDNVIVRARMVVNATGPWAAGFMHNVLRHDTSPRWGLGADTDGTYHSKPPGAPCTVDNDDAQAPGAASGAAQYGTSALGASHTANHHVTHKPGPTHRDANLAQYAADSTYPKTASMTPAPQLRELRLVKGSHIVVRSLFPHAYAYIFQHTDERIVFALPFEQQYTLIGTTDVDYTGPADAPAIDEAEIKYLCNAVNRYFQQRVTPADVVWSYSGVRALLHDDAHLPSETTRDYRLHIEPGAGAPALTIFGGKITTFRKLAEEALNLICPMLQHKGRAWTSKAVLPGGDILGFASSNASVTQFDRWVRDIQAGYAWVPPRLVARYARAYGTRIHTLLQDKSQLADLGEEVLPGLYETEIRYLMESEWARTADDILWRRSKLGLNYAPHAQRLLATWLAEHAQPPSPGNADLLAEPRTHATLPSTTEEV